MALQVKVKKGKQIYLPREKGSELFLRADGDDPFIAPEDAAVRGRLTEGMEAIITQQEFDAWGDEFFEITGTIQDEQVSARGLKTINRRNRMQTTGTNRMEGEELS